MSNYKKILRNALTLSLMTMFATSSAQALVGSAQSRMGCFWMDAQLYCTSGEASTMGGPPCVIISGETYCQDSTGDDCVWIDGVRYCN